MIVDTHAHLIEKYYSNLTDLLNSYKGLKVINCGTNLADNQEILNLCQNHTNLFGSLGIHPQNAEEWREKSREFILKHAQNKKIVAIGEIGLDYTYDVNRDLQKKIFEEQLKIAKNLQKPVIIHSREAFTDTYEILAKYPEIPKVLHCFAYGFQEAKQFLEINCLFGVNGIVTFKKSLLLQDFVKKIDLKYILVETDSPYLTPEPHRGKKNDSRKIDYVIAKIAELKGLKTKEIIDQTTLNAERIFDLNNN